MVMNVYKIKKWGGLLFASLFTVISFYIGFVFYGFVIAMFCMLGGMLAGTAIANAMIKNPFSDMLEGKGILFLNISSTGIIKGGILQLDQPYIKAKVGNKLINDVWDRKTVSQFQAPCKLKNKVEIKEEGGIKFDLSEKDFNAARFAFMQYPCLIYNEQVNSFITKDFLSDKETHAFAEHLILYFNRKAEQLHNSLRDFGRYVVETTRPKESWLQSKWTWIIIIIAAVILGMLFLPSIIKTFTANGSAITDTLGGAINTASAITPR